MTSLVHDKPAGAPCSAYAGVVQRPAPKPDPAKEGEVFDDDPGDIHATDPPTRPPKQAYLSDRWIFVVGVLVGTTRGKMWPENFLVKENVGQGNSGYGMPTLITGADSKEYDQIKYGNVELHGEEGRLQRM